MYSMPSSRRKGKNESKRLNLVPILDSVFILIFFLLLSASFLKIYEINSNVPIISSTPPPPSKKKPLGLTMIVTPQSIVIKTGDAPGRTIKTFGFNTVEDSFPYEELHSFMLELKKSNKDEKTIILEPNQEVDYDTIVKIMDSVRMIRKTDDAIFTKDKDGIDTKVEVLFDDIIFGNITS